MDRALRFYGDLFGWTFDVGPEEYGSYTTCSLRGRRAAGLSGMHDASTGAFWNVYLATEDCDRTAARIREAGGTVLMEPMDVGAEGRMALARDPVGAQFGIWQGRDHVGCEVVNEPGALRRNDLVTADPGPARQFYTAVFGFTLDGNDDLPDLDFTFLRRPDGHEMGASPAFREHRRAGPRCSRSTARTPRSGGHARPAARPTTRRASSTAGWRP